MAEDTPTLPKNAGIEIGGSGTLIWGGIITGEEYNRNLTGRNAFTQYEIMRRSDATIRSALQVVKLPLLATTWSIEPASDIDGNVSDDDKAVAAFIERELMSRKVNWHDFMRQSLSMLDFGFSVFEKVYELTQFDGQPRIGLAKLASRKQTTVYKWEISDGKLGVTQQLSQSPQNVEIPRQKLVVFTNEREGDNYEGISLLRYAFKDWDIKDKLTLVNAIALEKLGVGVPKAMAKPDATPTASDWLQVEAVLGNMRANEKQYLKMPATLDVEMLDLKGNTTKDVIPTLQFHNRSIYASILATFMDLGGSSGSGAKALSGDLTSLFMKSEEAVANNLVGAITADLIQQLCDLNFTELPNGYPLLKFGTIADDDTTALSQSVNLLAGVDMLTYDPELEDHLRGIFRFPELPEDVREIRQNEIDNPTPPPAAVIPPAETVPAPVDKKEAKKLEKQKAIRSAQASRRKLINVLYEE